MQIDADPSSYINKDNHPRGVSLLAFDEKTGGRTDEKAPANKIDTTWYGVPYRAHTWPQ